jgi:NitT/TauT family transport system substrate-binding protein
MTPTLTNPTRTNRPRRRRIFTSVAAGAAALLAFSLAACGSSGSSTTTAGGLKPLVVGIPSPAVTVFSANYAIGQYLGCYKRYGYQFSTVVTTNPSQLTAAFHRNAVDVGVPGSDQFLDMEKTISTGGGGLPLTAFYELDYPFKYGLAVKPDSQIHSLADLKGKTVGVDVLSDSSSATLKALLKDNGVDPNSVTIIASGVGAASGQALDSGKIDALFYYDVGYGTILQAGIKMKFVQIPHLNVSGILAVANSDDLKNDKAKLQAFTRCTTEGDIFVAANPAAAAYIMLKMYPALGKQGAPLEQQIAGLELPLMLRTKLLANPDASAAQKYGPINGDEFNEDAKVLGKTLPSNVASTFTNDLVPTLTDAEVKQVQDQAKNFSIPGVTASSIPVPTIPENAP